MTPSPRSLTLKSVAYLHTGDNTIERNVDVVVKNGVIANIGPRGSARQSGHVIDAGRLLVMPGLINAHTHSVQVLGRGVLPAQSTRFSDWQRGLAPVWMELDAESVSMTAEAAYAELLMGGSTTVVDHHSYYPNDVTSDLLVSAARRIGIRLVLARGGRSEGPSRISGELTEPDQQIADDWARLLHDVHDRSAQSMVRVALAPTSILSMSRELVRYAVGLAKRHDALVHLHLAETDAERRRAMRVVGQRPFRYAMESGILTPRTWIAHAIKLNSSELRELAEVGTAVAHCPSSNLRLGNGVASVVAMRRLGIRVGLGTDGAASNEDQSLAGEVRVAHLVQSGRHGPRAFSASEALSLATEGGAHLLRWPSLGRLAVGQPADMIGFDTEQLARSSIRTDPTSVVPLGLARVVDLAVVDGMPLVVNGDFTRSDRSRLLDRLRRAQDRVLDRAERKTELRYRRPAGQ